MEEDYWLVIPLGLIVFTVVVCVVVLRAAWKLHFKPDYHLKENDKTVINLFTLAATVSAACLTALISTSIFQMQTNVELKGDVNALNHVERHEGELLPGGDQLTFRSKIINSGQANAFIGRILLVDEGGNEVELVNLDSSAANERGETSSYEYFHYGFKLEPGQGAIFKLRLLDEDKRKITGKTYSKCCVECVNGEGFSLDFTQTSTASDCVTNRFELDSSLDNSD